jgi:diguanylate cyclase (GGDEF)-like protein/PAS domain S-box-containing protein
MKVLTNYPMRSGDEHFESRAKAVFAIAAITAFILLATTWKVAIDSSTAENRVAHTREVLDAINQIRINTLSIEYSTQGFRFTGEVTRLAERDVASSERTKALERLIILTASSAQQQERFAELREVLLQRMAIAKRVEELVRTEGSQTANDYVRTVPLQETRERVYQILGAMEAQERLTLDTDRNAQASARSRMLAMGVSVAILLLLILMTNYYMVRRQFQRLQVRQNELAASEENLSIILQSIGDGVVATDNQARVTRMNATAEEFTGWPAELARGRHIGEVLKTIHKSTRQPVVIPVIEVLTAGQAKALANHTLLIARDGSERPIADSASPIYDSAGQIQGVVLVFRDKTVEYHAEQAIKLHNELLEQRVVARTQQLQESEERYRTAFMTSPEPIILSRLQDGTYLDVNNGFEQTFGWSRDEVIGKTSLELGIWSHIEHRVEFIRRVHELGGLDDFETEFLTKQGISVVSLVSSKVISIDGQSCILTVVRDVTERQRISNALAASEKEFRLLADAMPQIVWVCDARGLNTYFNRQWVEYTGMSLQDSYGHDWNKPFHPDDQQRAWLAWQASILRGAVYELECRIRRQDGQYRWWLIRGIPVSTASGTTEKWFGTCTDIDELKQSQVAIHESKSKLDAALESMTDAVFISDVTGRFIDFNEAFASFHKFRNKAECAKTLAEYPDVLNVYSSEGDLLPLELWAVPRALRGESANNAEFRLERKDTGESWFGSYSYSPIRNSDGQIVGSVVSARDITERKHAEAKLQLASNVFDHAREAIIIADAHNSIVDINEAFTRITGYSREDVIGQNPRILNSNRQEKAFYEAMWGDLAVQGHWSGEIWNRRKNGEIYAALLTISAMRNEQGRVHQYVALYSDITAIKQHQGQLEHIAHFDALTNLPNRLLLADRLQQAMAQSMRRGKKIAVAYLDLDGFKNVNDRYGHDVGDKLLVHLATVSMDALREGDTLARLGGDEFVAVLIDLDSVESCVPMLTRLLKAAAAPVLLDNIVVQSSASIGVTFYPQDPEVEADQLLRQADQALYQAKLAGKNRYHLFDAVYDQNLRVHHESLVRINLALLKSEFVLHYQPKVNMRSGVVTGAEALIRWEHPERGLLAPAVFLPVIENHSLAVEVGEWVIDTALTQIESWQARGLDLAVSVNIGARQLQQSDFVHRLQTILAKHPKVNPASLEIEVLETSALADIQQVSVLIEDCHKMGVKFALDDFGTGYSSLTYLKRLHVAMLKIDQSFVRDMLEDPDDLAILEGIIGLAAAFKREVIAEGVETVEHGIALLHLGCALAQGFGIARPMPGDQMHAWVMSWQLDEAWRALRS